MPAFAAARAPVAVLLSEVSKRLGGARVLDGVSLDFLPGGFNTLLGPSGCGKTTLLRVIAGFVLPDSGRVLVGGRDQAGVPPWKRRLGIVFQSYALWPHMSVLDNVAYGLRLRRLGAGEVGARAEAALRGVGLEGAGPRYPAQLSGGQQQRVALARALVLEPDLLLLDEPLSNLDAQLRVEMRREIRRLQREVGVTAIYVTHDQHEALELSDRIAVMSAGRVEQSGRPEEIWRRPASEAVARFLGADVVAGEGRAGGEVLLAGGTLPCRLPERFAGRGVRLAVYPEDLRASPRGAEQQLSGVVAESAYLGSAWRVSVSLPGGVRLRATSEEPLRPGERAWLALRESALVGEAP